MKSILISTNEIKTAALVLRALNNSQRQDILYLLARERKLTVEEIYRKLQINQSTCSTQLGILRKEGIVAIERAAKNRLYYIVHRRLEEINLYAKALAVTSNI